MLPQYQCIGDLFPWRPLSGAVKIDGIGKIALREKYSAGKGITLQIFSQRIDVIHLYFTLQLRQGESIIGNQPGTDYMMAPNTPMAITQSAGDHRWIM